MRRKAIILRKRTFWLIRPTKTQFSLRIRAVWSDYLLSAWRNFVSLAIQNAPGKCFDQTAQMHKLIWIVARRTSSKVRFVTLRLYQFVLKI